MLSWRSFLGIVPIWSHLDKRRILHSLLVRCWKWSKTTSHLLRTCPGTRTFIHHSNEIFDNNLQCDAMFFHWIRFWDTMNCVATSTAFNILKVFFETISLLSPPIWKTPSQIILLYFEYIWPRIEAFCQ